jgi:hypothetical protein
METDDPRLTRRERKVIDCRVNVPSLWQASQASSKYDGKYLEIPVVVDWFPRRTDDQIFANAVARLNGQPDPYPDPNLITVRIQLL